MSPFSRLAGGFVALAGLAVPLHALANAVGSAVNVVPAAQSEGARGAIVLARGAEVNAFERVRTSVDGAVTLKFRDNSILEVGPGSLVTIDRFVYNPDNTAAEASLTMARGTFRWASGSSRKEAYNLKTPAATLGIRGTDFTVVADGDSTVIQLKSGAVRACSPVSGKCGEITRPGQGLRLFSDGRIDSSIPGGMMQRHVGRMHRMLHRPGAMPPQRPPMQAATNAAKQQPSGASAATGQSVKSQGATPLQPQRWQGTWLPKGEAAFGPRSPDALPSLPAVAIGATGHIRAMPASLQGRGAQAGPTGMGGLKGMGMGPGGFAPGGIAGPQIQPPRVQMPGPIGGKGPANLPVIR